MSSDVQAIRSLPRPEVEQLREWPENFLEDRLELPDDFKARIERGKSDIATRDRMSRIRDWPPSPSPSSELLRASIAVAVLIAE
jgi:hypothetical protein